MQFSKAGPEKVDANVAFLPLTTTYISFLSKEKQKALSSFLSISSSDHVSVVNPPNLKPFLVLTITRVLYIYI